MSLLPLHECRSWATDGLTEPTVREHVSRSHVAIGGNSGTGVAGNITGALARKGRVA
jgi:hypothetical protein